MEDQGRAYRLVFSIGAWFVACSVMMVALMPFAIPLYETWGDPPHFRRELAELNWYYSGGLGLSCAAVLIGWHLLRVRRGRGTWPSWLAIPSAFLLLASLARFLFVSYALTNG